jgi:uncharacterized membrane protein SirB2
MKIFRNKKLDHGYGGDMPSFIFGVILIILGVRMVIESGNWIVGAVICFLLSIPLMMYAMSYRLVDKESKGMSSC